MLRRYLSAFISLFSLTLALAVFAPAVSHAQVKVYRAGKSPQFLAADLQVSSLERGTASQQVRMFIHQHRAFFGLQKADGQVLTFKKWHRDAKGATIRFVQSYQGVRIEGAEVIAILNSQGKLLSLNSSLYPTPAGLNTQPSLTKK